MTAGARPQNATLDQIALVGPVLKSLVEFFAHDLFLGGPDAPVLVHDIASLQVVDSAPHVRVETDFEAAPPHFYCIA